MIKAIIFDFDDTLCLTEKACFRLENEVLKKMGRSPMSRSIHQSNWGVYLPQAIVERSPGVDVKEYLRIHATILQEKIESGSFDQITQETLNILDGLAKDGFMLMILTGRDEYELKHLMDPSHHLGSRISHFYHKDNNEFHKPDPRTFEIIEKEHNLKPNECVYVGDSVGDAKAAKEAGLHLIISLEAGIRGREDFKEYLVDDFIFRLTDLPKALRKLTSETN